MSLILDALRKLDREKSASERSVLVVAAAAWPDRPRPWWPLGVAALAVAAAGVVALTAWSGRRPANTAEARPAAPAAAAPTPALAVAAPVTFPPPPRVVPVSRRAVPDAAAERETGAPARPGAAPAAVPAGAPRLQAITARDGQPIALINDRLMREGDEFDGIKVLAIGPSEVEVEVHGRRSTLRF